MRGRCRFLSKSAVRHFTYQTNVSAMDAVDNHRKFFENNYLSLGGIVALLVRPFADDAVHFEHVLAKLLKRESEREKSLRRFAFHVARQSLGAQRRRRGGRRVPPPRCFRVASLAARRLPPATRSRRRGRAARCHGAIATTCAEEVRCQGRM